MKTKDITTFIEFQDKMINLSNVTYVEYKENKTVNVYFTGEKHLSFMNVKEEEYNKLYCRLLNFMTN